MENIENAIKHLKARNFTGQQIDMAIEALEKQIPKKVVKGKITSQSCPKCSCPVNRNYCGNCGQRIKY